MLYLNNYIKIIMTTLTRITIVFVSLILYSCGNFAYDMATQPVLHAPPVNPEVHYTYPAANEQHVSLNTSVLIYFTKNIDSSSISSDQVLFQDTSGNQIETGISFYGDKAVLIQPASRLKASCEYIITLQAGITDTEGISLTEPHSWQFTTGTDDDNLPPEITATLPGKDGLITSEDTTISISLNEDINPFTITSSAFTLQDSEGTTVAGTISYEASGKTIFFTPTSQLRSNTVYVATLNSGEAGIADLAGKQMQHNYTWYFSTDESIQNLPPVVLSVSPSDTSEITINWNKQITVVFNKAIDELSINENNIYFSTSSGPVTISNAAYDATTNTATYTADCTLLGNTGYSVTLLSSGSSAITDMSGQPVRQDYTWTFSTDNNPEYAPPAVIVTSPESNETIAVSWNKKITVSMSKNIDPATVHTGNISITDGSTSYPVTNAVHDGSTLTYTTGITLDANKTYTATVHSSGTDILTDERGQPLSADYSWSFVTDNDPAYAPPAVSNTSPETNETLAVNWDKKITITMSKTIDPATVHTDNLSVTDGSTIFPVTGVTYTSNSMTYTVDVTLEANKTYTATLHSSGINIAKDERGQPLAADYSWSFITNNNPAYAEPLVIATTPANSGTHRTWQTHVDIQFNKDMDGDSLRGENLTISDSHGNLTIADSVSYNAAARTATFTVTSYIYESSSYTATLKSTVSNTIYDFYANEYTEIYTWNFSTGAARFAANEPVSNFDYGFAAFGSGSGTDSQGNATGKALVNTDDSAFSPAVDSLITNYSDSSDSGLLTDPARFRILVNGSNAKTGLALDVYTKDFDSGLGTPTSDRVFVDPQSGQLLLPRPVFWSKMESTANIANAEIGSGSYTIDRGSVFTVEPGIFNNGLKAEYSDITINTNISNQSRGTISFWIRELNFVPVGSAISWWINIGNTRITIYRHESGSCNIGITIPGVSAQTNNLPVSDLTTAGLVTITWDIAASKKITAYYNNTEYVAYTDNDFDSSGPLSIQIFGQIGILLTDNIKIWNEVISTDATTLYNIGSTENALHPIYGAGNNYSINNVQVGYYYLP